MSPEAVAAMTSWVETTDSLRQFQFTPDASVVTPAGKVDGGLAAESFANGTLEGSRYRMVALTTQKVSVCDDRVVIIEGTYDAMVTGGGASSVAQPNTGPFLIRAVVDAQGAPHANLVRLGMTQEIRTRALARGCNQPAAYRFASRPWGITVFGLGMPFTPARSDALAAMKDADWYCPAPTTCAGKHNRRSAGPFIQAYARERPGYGIQLLAGRLWETDVQGYRIGNHTSRSGPVTLRNTTDALGATLYVERRNLRLAAGPALLRSSWFFDAHITKADSLGFNAARKNAIKPALLAAATLMLPVGSRVDLEVTAVGDLAGTVAPPSLLEFQPGAITASAITLAIGLGIRP